MIRFILLILSFLSFCMVLPAQELRVLSELPGGVVGQPEPSATGSLLLGDSLEDLLDQTFDSVASSTPVTGFNAAMILPDGRIWRRASGLAQSSPQERNLEPADLMGMGSITKSFTAAAVLMLVEDGMLSLDDSLGAYVGPYPNVDGGITIRQLLSHRSGLNDYLNENDQSLEDLFTYPDSIWETDTVLTHYVLEPNFEPDASWSYSNTNYLIAGRIIEEVTGKEWYTVVRERIIDPLELEYTFAYPYETPADSHYVAHAYADFTGLGIQDLQGSGFDLRGVFSLAGAAGCLLSNPTDIAVFTEALHGGDLLSAASLDEMHMDYMRSSVPGSQYGLGASSFHLPQGIENWGHNGGIIYLSLALYFPDKEVTIVVQQNDERSTADNPPVNDVNIMTLALLNACLEYAISTSTRSLAPEFSLKIFPNPAYDVMTIQFPQDRKFNKADAYVYNAQGKMVEQFRVHSSDVELNVRTYVPGIYVLRVGEMAELFEVQ